MNHHLTTELLFVIIRNAIYSSTLAVCYGRSYQNCLFWKLPIESVSFGYIVQVININNRFCSCWKCIIKFMPRFCSKVLGANKIFPLWQNLAPQNFLHNFADGFHDFKTTAPTAMDVRFGRISDTSREDKVHILQCSSLRLQSGTLEVEDRKLKIFWKIIRWLNE